MKILTTISLVGPKKDSDGWDHDLWKVEIRYGSNSAEFSYRTGTGLRGSDGMPVRPSVASVFYALADDYRAYEECSDDDETHWLLDFAENNSRFPINSADDLRDLVRVFAAVKESALKLRALFGSDLAEFLDGASEEPES
jgi:hypothetical protein